MTVSVAIMGAGPGGLAAAMLLAARGARVDIYERLQRVGGRSGRLTADGFHFDTGATFFLYPQVLREIFHECGRDLDGELELVKVDPQYHLVFENHGELKATPNIAKMRQEIARFSKPDAANLETYLRENRKKLERFKPVLERPFSSIKDFFNLPMLKALPLLNPQRSVDADLRRFFSDERVRLAFSFQSKYLGMSPFQCPSLFTILSFMEYEYGVYHPIGSCNQVMRVMARVAAEMGVNIHLGEPVEKLHFDGRRFQAVETKRGKHQPDTLVVNADFGKFAEDLVPQRLLKRWKAPRLAKKRYSCSTFMLYLGIKGRYDHLEHHTIFLSEDYKNFLHEIERGGALPAQPSIYIQNACRTDPSVAPDGCSTLYVLVPVANLVNPVDWPGQKVHFRNKIIEKLKTLGLGDLEKRIVFEKIVTPLDWKTDLSVYQGATFNLAHCMSQLLLWRPNNRFEELDGVYLTGGGTHPGSGLPVISLKAREYPRI